MTYHGGPVQRTQTEYFIYWEPSGYGLPAQWPAYKTGLDQWLTNVATASGTSSNVFGTANQYYDTVSGPATYINYSVTNGGSVVATDALPASGCTNAPHPDCLTDAQLKAEIQSVVVGNGLPQNSQTQYILFTPQGVGSCFDGSSTSCSYNQYCAYHSAFSGPSGEIVYANQPWSYQESGCDPFLAFPSLGGGYPNGPSAPSIDPEVGTLSHELMETITDVNLNAWYEGDLGHEIGDKCAYNYNGTTYGSGSGLSTNGNGDYNQTINGHQYLMQTEYSNAESNGTTTGCVPRGPVTASLGGAPSSPVGAGGVVPFDASGSSTSFGTIATNGYSWNFGDGSPVVTTAAAPHAFSLAGTYSVTLTVTDSNHFVDTKSASVTVTSTRPTAAFAVTTAHPAKGVPVQFNATSSTDPAGITSYSWNFGDGSTGSGATPSHVYSAPGTYAVSLTVTGRSGLTGSVTHNLSVAKASTITKVKTKKRGRVLVITVNGAGTISVGKKHKTVNRAATVKFTLKFTKKQKRRLTNGFKVKDKLRITFVPVAGPTVVRKFTAVVKPMLFHGVIASVDLSAPGGILGR
jgi:PKD repeat protein